MLTTAALAKVATADNTTRKFMVECEICWFVMIWKLRKAGEAWPGNPRLLLFIAESIPNI
jgi:hypothetical protein